MRCNKVSTELAGFIDAAHVHQTILIKIFNLDEPPTRKHGNSHRQMRIYSNKTR